MTTQTHIERRATHLLAGLPACLIAAMECVAAGYTNLQGLAGVFHAREAAAYSLTREER